MTSLQFGFGSTLKTLNLLLLWFIERSKSENHGNYHSELRTICNLHNELNHIQ